MYGVLAALQMFSSLDQSSCSRSRLSLLLSLPMMMMMTIYLVAVCGVYGSEATTDTTSTPSTTWSDFTAVVLGSSSATAITATQQQLLQSLIANELGVSPLYVTVTLWNVTTSWPWWNTNTSTSNSTTNTSSVIEVSAAALPNATCSSMFNFAQISAAAAGYQSVSAYRQSLLTRSMVETLPSFLWFNISFTKPKSTVRSNVAGAAAKQQQLKTNNVDEEAHEDTPPNNNNRLEKKEDEDVSALLDYLLSKHNQQMVMESLMLGGPDVYYERRRRKHQRQQRRARAELAEGSLSGGSASGSSPSPGSASGEDDTSSNGGSQPQSTEETTTLPPLTAQPAQSTSAPPPPVSPQALSLAFASYSSSEYMKLFGILELRANALIGNIIFQPPWLVPPLPTTVGEGEVVMDQRLDWDTHSWNVLLPMPMPIRISSNVAVVGSLAAAAAAAVTAASGIHRYGLVQIFAGQPSITAAGTVCSIQRQEANNITDPSMTMLYHPIDQSGRIFSSAPSRRVALLLSSSSLIQQKYSATASSLLATAPEAMVLCRMALHQANWSGPSILIPYFDSSRDGVVLLSDLSCMMDNDSSSNASSSSSSLLGTSCNFSISSYQSKCNPCDHGQDLGLLCGSGITAAAPASLVRTALSVVYSTASLAVLSHNLSVTIMPGTSMQQLLSVWAHTLGIPPVRLLRWSRDTVFDPDGSGERPITEADTTGGIWHIWILESLGYDDGSATQSLSGWDISLLLQSVNAEGMEQLWHVDTTSSRDDPSSCSGCGVRSVFRPQQEGGLYSTTGVDVRFENTVIVSRYEPPVGLLVPQVASAVNETYSALVRVLVDHGDSTAASTLAAQEEAEKTLDTTSIDDAVASTCDFYTNGTLGFVLLIVSCTPPRAGAKLNNGGCDAATASAQTSGVTPAIRGILASMSQMTSAATTKMSLIGTEAVPRFENDDWAATASVQLLTFSSPATAARVVHVMRNDMALFLDPAQPVAAPTAEVQVASGQDMRTVCALGVLQKALTAASAAAALRNNAPPPPTHMLSIALSIVVIVVLLALSAAGVVFFRRARLQFFAAEFEKHQRFQFQLKSRHGEDAEEEDEEMLDCRQREEGEGNITGNNTEPLLGGGGGTSDGDGEVGYRPPPPPPYTSSSRGGGGGDVATTANIRNKLIRYFTNATTMEYDDNTPRPRFDHDAVMTKVCLVAATPPQDGAKTTTTAAGVSSASGATLTTHIDKHQRGVLPADVSMETLVRAGTLEDVVVYTSSSSSSLPGPSCEEEGRLPGMGTTTAAAAVAPLRVDDEDLA